MLPNNRYTGLSNDDKFILAELVTVDQSHWVDICNRYSAGYKKVYDDHPVYIEKEGEARRRANIWLRKYIKKLNGKYNGSK